MSEAPATLTATRLMRMAEVQTRTGIKSRSTVYELEAQGLFPARVHLTGKAIAFVEAEVDAWIRSRIEARPAPEATPATRPARLRHRTAATTRPSTGHQTASQAGATPPTSTSSTSESSTPPRRRGPARTRAQRQQGLK